MRTGTVARGSDETGKEKLMSSEKPSAVYVPPGEGETV
jgi:hypothetical protein